jgi:hypothetical protein
MKKNGTRTKINPITAHAMVMIGAIRIVLRMLSLGAAESLLAVVADLPQRKSTKQRMKLRSAS